MISPRATSGVAAALGLVMLLAAGAGAQGPEPLFAEVSPPQGLASTASSTAEPFVVRTSYVRLLDLPWLRSLTFRTAGFLLNLFPDTSLALTFERLETSGLGHVSWVGHIRGRPASSVVITRKGLVVSGTVTDGETVYQITPLPDGVQRIDQIDVSQLPPDVDITLPAPSPVGPAAPAFARPAADPPLVDIYVFYTSALRGQLGTDAVQTRIVQSVTEANSSYARSGIPGRLRLVGYGEIGLTDPDDPEVLLNSFSNNPSVRGTRDQAQADVVALLVTGMSSSPGTIACGVGWVGLGVDAAYSVTASRPECVYSFVHEVGHNFGAQHATEDGVITGPGFPSYARGYKAPDHAFRTVMAYGCTSPPACGRVLNFSSPAVNLGGQPTGTTSQDNARRLNETFALVSTFRSPNPTPSPPSPPRALQATTMGLTATLTWLPPATGTPTTYWGALGTAPGLSDLGQQDIGPNTSVTVTLGPGTYYARIHAQNEVGIGAPSNDVRLVLAPLAPPGPPSGLVRAVSGSLVTLAWNAPSSGGSVYDYLVYAGSAPGRSDIVNGFSLFGTTTSFDGVPPGRYYVRVRARNAAGVGPASNEVVVDVSAPCVVPSAPRGLSFTRSGNAVTLRWQPPATGGAGVTYVLQAGSRPGSSDLVNVSVGGATSISTTVGAGTYYVRVRAVAACGASPASPEIIVNVP